MKKNNDSNFDQLNNYSIQDLFQDKKLDIVAAALLLTGKLKVDSVEMFRGSPTVNVTLVGKYKTKDNKRVNNMVDFMDENGDITLNEVIEAMSHVMNQQGR